MAAEKFYLCTHCGNLVGMIHSSGVPIVCCGEPMKALVPNTVDAAGEKHLPVVTREGDKVVVSVGSVAHPMVAEHLIQWVYLETNRGGHRCALAASDEPKAVFMMADGEKPVAAYAYCNLHGLWKTAL